MLQACRRWTWTRRRCLPWAAQLQSLTSISVLKPLIAILLPAASAEAAATSCAALLATPLFSNPPDVTSLALA